MDGFFQSLHILFFVLSLSFSFASSENYVQVNPDGSTTTNELHVPELEIILKNAGRNIKLASQMLKSFDIDSSGGLSEEEFMIFKSKRKSPEKFHYDFHSKKSSSQTSNRKKSSKSSKQRKKKIIEKSSSIPTLSPMSAKALEKYSQQVMVRFREAQQKMQQSVNYLSAGNVMQFMKEANSARMIATRIIESLPKQLFNNNNYQEELPEWLVQIYVMTSKFLHVIADQTSNRKFLHEALFLVNVLLKHSSKKKKIYLESLIEASQLLVELARFCDGVELLEEYRKLRQDIGQVKNGDDPYRSALESLPERSLQQYTLGSHNCNASLSLMLFGHIVDMGYLNPMKPDVCIKCWGIYGIVLRDLGHSEKAVQFFNDRKFSKKCLFIIIVIEAVF
jgi:hypothetical protein